MKTHSPAEETNTVIDLGHREIRHHSGACHKLSRLEFELLSWLMGRAGQTVSRAEIIARVWRLDPLRTVTRTVDMHVSMLRKKLGEDSRNPSRLVTVYRVGYMMRAAAENLASPAHN